MIVQSIPATDSPQKSIAPECCVSHRCGLSPSSNVSANRIFDQQVDNSQKRRGPCPPKILAVGSCKSPKVVRRDDVAPCDQQGFGVSYSVATFTFEMVEPVDEYLIRICVFVRLPRPKLSVSIAVGILCLFVPKLSVGVASALPVFSCPLIRQP